MFNMDTITILNTLKSLGYWPIVIRGTVQTQQDFENNIYYQVDGEEVPVSAELDYNTFLSAYNSKHPDTLLDEVRVVRNKKLAETDWTQLPDVSEAIKNSWRTYRQSLRDITDNCTSLDDVVWPTKPN